MSSISFAGCSWFLAYHLGVGKFIQEHLEPSRMQFLGASSGSVVALMLAAEADCDEGFESACEFARHSKSRLLGPVGKMTHYLSTGLKSHLPSRAFKRVAGRLFISVTELPFFKNKLVSLENPRSNEEVFQLILASCYIPIYYERPVSMNGKFYIDGGLTNNAPALNSETILVSPKPSWHQKVFHIFPKKEPQALHAFFPDLKVMNWLFKEGYRNARKFWKEKSTKGPFLKS